MKFRNLLWVLSALLSFATAVAAPRPWEGDAKSYKVLVMGDAHFDGAEFHKAPPQTDGRKSERGRNVKMWKAKSPALFAAAGKRAAAENAAFAVQLGDLVQGDCDNAKLQGRMIRKGFEAIKKNFPDIPLLIVKGNHDIRVVGNSRNNAAANAALLPIISKELGRKVAKNSCYAFTRGRDLFIAVDGFVPEKTIEAFVKKTLAANPDTRYVFFMTHLPILPGSIRAPFWMVPGYAKIAAMLETRNTLILAAHTHAPSLSTRTTRRGKLTQLIVASLGSSWMPKRGKAKFRDWASFASAVEKEIPKAKKPEKMRKLWADWQNSGEMTFRSLFGNSGFVVLDIDDRRVTARYYINASDKPAVTLELLTDR